MHRFKLAEFSHIDLIILIILSSFLSSCSTISSGLHNGIAFKLAIRNLNHENYPGAIKHFNRVINNLPEDPRGDQLDGTAWLYYSRGYAYIKNNDCFNGLLDLQKASNLVEEAYDKGSFNENALKELSSNINSASKNCNSQRSQRTKENKKIGK